MASTFNIGDVVRLKSGGPKMTVIGAGTSPEGYATVSGISAHETDWLS